MIDIVVTLVSVALFDPYAVGDFPNIKVVSEPALQPGVGYWG